MKISSKDNFKGMTLMEVITVLIIIGIFAAFAIPRFNLLMEKMKAEGQMAMLTPLYDAQQRYRLTNRNEYFVAGDHKQLGVEIVTSDHFNPPTLGCGTAATCNGGSNVIFCDASGGHPWLVETQRDLPYPMDYFLYILQDGTPTCVDADFSCKGICKKLGFVSLEDL